MDSCLPLPPLRSSWNRTDSQLLCRLHFRLSILANRTVGQLSNCRGALFFIPESTKFHGFESTKFHGFSQHIFLPIWGERKTCDACQRNWPPAPFFSLALRRWTPSKGQSSEVLWHALDLQIIRTAQLREVQNQPLPSSVNSTNQLRYMADVPRDYAWKYKTVTKLFLARLPPWSHPRTQETMQKLPS